MTELKIAHSKKCRNDGERFLDDCKGCRATKEYYGALYRQRYGAKPTRQLCRNHIAEANRRAGDYSEEPLPCLDPDRCKGDLSESLQWWEGKENHVYGCNCENCVEWYRQMKG